jgi:hypothetical protein
MPFVRYGIAAAAAACLLSGVAVANADTPMGAQSAPADQSTMPPSADQSAPAAATSSADTSAKVNAAGVTVIASQPVPDTPANRAAYGQPLSRAGKHTAPRGN